VTLFTWVFRPNHSTWVLVGLSRSCLVLIHAFTSSRQRANRSVATEASLTEEMTWIWQSSAYWCRRRPWLATTCTISAVYRWTSRVLGPLRDAELYQLYIRQLAVTGHMSSSSISFASAALCDWCFSTTCKLSYLLASPADWLTRDCDQLQTQRLYRVLQ